MNADSIVGILISILRVHTLGQRCEGIGQTLILLHLLLLFGCELAVALDVLEALIDVHVGSCLVEQ